jgi:hypothetical protein
VALQTFHVNVIVTQDQQGNIITVAQYQASHSIGGNFVVEARGQVQGPFQGTTDAERYNDAIAKCKADLASKLDQVKLAI